MFYLISFLWLIRETKSILFWLYLWQLKEYHIGRFIDHFRTEKGKRLLFNKLFLLKIIFLISFFFYPFSLPLLLLILYLTESLKVLKDHFSKTLKFPVWTKKTIFLISITLIFAIYFLFCLFGQGEISLFYLLIFDIFTPAIVSGITLVFQPLIAFFRNQTIKKGKIKRAKFKNLLVIGITGSYGKTSTKEFLHTILVEKFGENKVLKTKEHQNSEIGISQCILNDLKEEHEIFVVEMGAYNKGGIKLLCDIARPKIGILTGINEQHMATFGSQENIIKAKYELIESLPENGIAIFNGSDPHVFKLFQKTKKPKRIFGYKKIADRLQPDLLAKDITVKKDYISFKVEPQDEESTNFKVNLLGAQNIPNLLAAILVARELGMGFQEIRGGCERIRPGQGAMRLIKTKDGLNVIDSTYSANPDGVMAHLGYLKIWEGKKIIVLPCLIELGGASKRIHQEIGEGIGQVCDLAIVTTKDRFKEIKEGAIKNGMPKENLLFLENPKEIFEKIKSFCSSGDVILLESRVPEEAIKSLSD